MQIFSESIDVSEGCRCGWERHLYDASQGKSVRGNRDLGMAASHQPQAGSPRKLRTHSSQAQAGCPARSGSFQGRIRAHTSSKSGPKPEGAISAEQKTGFLKN